MYDVLALQLVPLKKCQASRQYIIPKLVKMGTKKMYEGKSKDKTNMDFLVRRSKGLCL